MKYKSKTFFIKVLPNMEYSNVNVIISKKIVKTSVVRNKYKRRLKEVLRKYYSKDLTNLEFYLYTNKNILNLTFWDIKDELSLIMKKIR
tara:strand:- start:58 stop:324 length:267 start_codon:yes stop_codon:yes gene_type:complete